MKGRRAKDHVDFTIKLDVQEVRLYERNLFQKFCAKKVPGLIHHVLRSVERDHFSPWQTPQQLRR